jgi:acyl-CoA reductase-like NAD-dependent aldehyde dehydrogenase
MGTPVFSGCERLDATLMVECVFEPTMQPAEQPSPTLPPEGRPVFPPTTRRGPEHELKDRAKAAKLRHRAAKARLKANHLEDRTRHLRLKADQMDRRADQLDGVSRPEASTPVNE